MIRIELKKNAEIQGVRKDTEGNYIVITDCKWKLYSSEDKLLFDGNINSKQTIDYIFTQEKKKSIKEFIEERQDFNPSVIHPDFGVVEWSFETSINKYSVKIHEDLYRIRLLVHGSSYVILDTNNLHVFENFYNIVKL